MCSSEETQPDGGAGQPLAIDTALLARHDVRAPRYTSYPTAPQFSDALGESAYRRGAQACHQPDAPLSVYVHIPFCRTVCFYCGCNKVITANYRRAGDYLERLAREMALQAPLFAGRAVTQLHFGGGTPTYLNEVDLRRVMADLARHFRLIGAPAREYSIEIDPRTVDPGKVALLAALGFNRMSLGIQDFDPDVQRAVNRRQSLQQTAAVLDAPRHVAFDVIGERHGVRFAEYFAPELARLQPLAADGLVAVGPDALRVTPRGWLFLRNLAMVFDAYLPAQGAQAFSRAL